MIPEANILSGKTSVASVNRAGTSEPLSWGFRGWSPLRKFLVSKDHLDWLKIDLNAVKIWTVQDYIRTKKLIQIFQLRVKQVTYESNI